MTVSYSHDIFILISGQSISLEMVFGSNFDTGGDYKGPIVVAGIPIAYTNYGLIPSTVQVLFPSFNELASPCKYRYTITNENREVIPFNVHYFHD
ncbi:hypothetical protein [Bacillus cereus]|uniref:hypothetical protein n=1 Tax=Bacillus cereus TaxID=1396 RepID=UPI000BF50B50|nr:hypothetical protein [Bacillus cereus]MEB9844521.1 hypothetical protein [Bacillus cereus]PEZ14679.1 hypothetical protein CN365_29310 [Bacillus cereus]